MSKKVDTLIKEYYLNQNEEFIFRLLNKIKYSRKNYLSIKEIQEKIDTEARTTILYTLNKLIKRKLINFIKINRSICYFAIKETKEGTKNEIMSYEDIIEHVSSVSKSKYFYGIQSSSAVKYLISKAIHNPSLFLKVHRTQKIRQVVIDSIIDEKGFVYLKEAKLKNETKHSHFGRPTIMSIVKEVPLPLYTEVLTDGIYVYILNHSKKNYEVIKSTELASVYIALIEYLKKDSRKISQTEIWL